MCKLRVEEQVEEFLPYAGVTKEQLDRISCVQLDNFNVDNIDAYRGGDSAAKFFEPSGPIDDDLKDILSRHWLDLGPGQASRVYAEYRSGWYMNPWDKDDWVRCDKPIIDRFGGSAWLLMRYVWNFNSCDLPLHNVQTR